MRAGLSPVRMNLVNMLYPPYLYPVRIAGEMQCDGASPAFNSLHPEPFSLTADSANSSSLEIP